MRNAIDTAAEACGTLTKLASALNVSPQVVVNWRARGVPMERCADLETASGGAVRRWDLRPDDWYRIWPELIGIDGAPVAPSAAKQAA